MKILDLLHNRKSSIQWPEPPRDPRIPTTAVQIMLIGSTVAIDGYMAMKLDVACDLLSIGNLHSKTSIIDAGGESYVSYSNFQGLLSEKIQSTGSQRLSDYLEYVDAVVRAVRDDPNSRALRDQTRSTTPN